MRGYPKTSATKADFQFLLSQPEFQTRARADLQALADLDDDMATAATELLDAKNPEGEWKTQTIPNSRPLWKQKGFKSREEARLLEENR